LTRPKKVKSETAERDAPQVKEPKRTQALFLDVVRRQTGSKEGDGGLGQTQPTVAIVDASLRYVDFLQSKKAATLEELSRGE
jgi:hypothetical protein